MGHISRYCRETVVLESTDALWDELTPTYNPQMDFVHDHYVQDEQQCAEQQQHNYRGWWHGQQSGQSDRPEQAVFNGGGWQQLAHLDALMRLHGITPVWVASFC